MIPPFLPEMLDDLCKRLPQALEPVYDVDLCLKGMQTMPGAQRRHIFDCEDGLRLIVSRDWIDGRAITHLSASLISISRVFTWRRD